MAAFSVGFSSVMVAFCPTSPLGFLGDFLEDRSAGSPNDSLITQAVSVTVHANETVSLDLRAVARQ